MAVPSVTYPSINLQLSDGPEVAQNFTDIINSLTDGTKSLTIAALTATTGFFSGVLTVSPNTQNASLIRRYVNAGDGTGSTGLRIGNSGAAQGDAQFFYTNAAASGAPNSTWTFTPRNNANTSNTDAVRITLSKVAGNDGGSVQIQTSTTAGTIATAMTITETQSVIFGSAAISTTATDGFLYIVSCAGAPTGVPTAISGRVAMIYDTTNNKLYIYNGGWKSILLS